MEDQAEEKGEETQRRRRFKKRYWPLIGLLVFVLLLAIAWTQRVPLARDFIQNELANRNVEAEFDVVEIGTRRQRIENIVLGDPENPDLTADWAEVYVRLRWGTPEIIKIVAHGVRLDGEIFADGGYSFGQVDYLLPEPTGEPFSLPELNIALSDSAVRLRTPYGPVAIAVSGSGWLDDGFAGFMAARGRALRYVDCDLDNLRIDVAIAIDRRRPEIEGPVRASSVQCTEQAIELADSEIDVDAVFSERFDRWGGDAALAFASLRQGDVVAGATNGAIAFDGSADGPTRGRLSLAGNAFRTEQGGVGGLATAGYYRFDPETGIAAYDGDVRLADTRLADGNIAPLASALDGADGTPLAPLGRRLAAAIAGAAREFDTQFRLTGAVGPRGGFVRLANIRGQSESGARLVQSGGTGLRYAWPRSDLALDGTVRLVGGGFPEALVSLEQDGSGLPLRGNARIAPLETADSRLVLAPVSFSATPGGRTLFRTVAELSGPLAGGRVEQLRVPIDGVLGQGGAVVVGPGCQPVSWARLRVASLTIGPADLPLCPVEGGSLLRYAPGRGLSGGAQIAGPRIRAMLGSTPLTVSASRFRLPLSRAQFAADDVAVRMGAGESVSALDLDRIEADFVTGGVDGRFSGAFGALANVPLRMEEAAGRWRFVDGVLDVNGEADVIDSSPDDLFEPLHMVDMALHLENNRIDMSGQLVEPDTGTDVAMVDLTHDLNTGVGEALLKSERIEFNERFQPTDLTRLVLGIVTDVEGLVSGDGFIRWDTNGNVTSGGTYELVDVDLAAPFGPVNGISTRLEFTDLLGLNTEPGQMATIAQINPGIVAELGEVRYQLLDSNRVQVEGATWPFAGGTITLEPTILDFRVDQERRMVFRVEGVDAFLFLEQRNFENIIATGLFDGTLPMVFDQNGGRIEGGRLVSRAGGGTFSYTGEISDVNLGVFGTLAFNALELIRYSELSIEFDGAIDGEMVTNVQFTGISPNVSREGQNFLIAGFTRELSRIPLQFDITLEAPFNQMLYSLRLIDDPGFLVNQAIRARVRRIQAEQGVQPPVSEDMP